MFLIGLAGCTSPSEEPSPENTETAGSMDVTETPTPLPTPTPTPAQEIEDKIIFPKEVANAFREALLGQAEFRDVWEGTATSKNLLFEGQPPTAFAVVDMDGDGIPEVVVKEIEQAHTLVLHCIDDVVYGHFFGPVGLRDIKTDGSFWYSEWYLEGVRSAEYSTIMFTANGYEKTMIAFQDWSDSEERMFFLIGDEEVTEGEWLSFIVAQKEKEDIVWHDLTEENVLQYVTWE
jgi:hypothetical protein